MMEDRAWPPSPLWEFALRSYARPGVAALCLELQDRHGIDVCLLLLARWLVVTGREPSHASLARCKQLAMAWRERVVVPLRRVRQVLKPDQPGQPPHADGVPVASIRALVVQAELAAERALLVSMEALLSGPVVEPSENRRDLLAELCPEAVEAQFLIEDFIAATTV